MNQAIRKITSIFLLAIFLSGSGGGQLVHSIFHKHPAPEPAHSSISVSMPRTVCNALQLMLPEFSVSILCGIRGVDVVSGNFFEEPQTTIAYHHFFKTSDRAPPVLA